MVGCSYMGRYEANRGYSNEMRGIIQQQRADLGGTKLGPRMGVGVLGLLRIPLLLGLAFLLSIDTPCKGARWTPGLSRVAFVPVGDSAGVVDGQVAE